MAKFTFPGGIHINEGKGMSKDTPIKTLLPKRELVYPLSLQYGAPTSPIVSVGDRVLAGQKIAEGKNYLSVPILSSVSGTVVAIEDRLQASGSIEPCIVIENDGLYENVGFYPVAPLDKLTSQEILDIVRDAGIVGLGGFGTPTHVKLAPKNPRRIEFVIANCAESEPYLTSDYRRVLEEPDRLIGGMKILLKMFPKARAILAVDEDCPECLSVLRQLTRNERKISVRAVKAKYPQGNERQLIYVTTGRSIRSKMNASDVGCIVHNIDTIIAIYHAVVEGHPLLDRVLTVSGDAVKNPRNYRVHIGMSYQELVDEIGGFETEPAKILTGGPMTGAEITDLNVPMTRTANALLAFKQDETANIIPEPCIRCGRCVDVCPAKLLPACLADLAQNDDTEGFLDYHGQECIECGCCSYICPAKRQLAQDIKMYKRQIASYKRGE